MIELHVNSFVLFCEEDTDKGLIVKKYEGNDSILDMSDTAIKCIDKKVFLSCKSLKKIIFPATLEKIGDWGFSKCTNLKSVRFKSEFKADIFGKGVFDGCTSLEKISFANFDTDLEVLFSATVNRLSNDILFRSDEVGEKAWLEKWDLSLLSMLRAVDADNKFETTACGEEDISYSGMVDGEMPSNADDFNKAKEKNKCFLCFERLLHAKSLEPNAREAFEKYIIDHGFGKKDYYAWITLKEDCQDEVEYYKLYLDIVKPDKTVINEMIADLDNTQVQTKAFLINEASANDTTDSFFDDLLF